MVLTDVADCLRAFGGLVVAEAEGRAEESEQALAASLEILRETRAILTELIMVDARENPSSWLLRGSILTAVEQVLDQLDLRIEPAAREWREEQDARPLAQLPPIIEGVLWHPEHPYPRALTPGSAPAPSGSEGRQGVSDQEVIGVVERAQRPITSFRCGTRRHR